MNLLLDTHALIWWVAGDTALSRKAHTAIADARNTVFVSAVSAYEIAQKRRRGKLPSAAALAQQFERVAAVQGFTPLALSPTHAGLAGRYPAAHGDPFDRMLAAQAEIEQMPLVSCDPKFAEFEIPRLW